MAKLIENQDEKSEGIDTFISKSEQYIEENQKSLTIIIGAIVLVVLLFVGYRKLILGPKEKEASSQMFIAQQNFERDSFKLALNGDGVYPGFIGIIEDYGITKSANLAHAYAGICYLHLGNFEESITHLKKFDSGDQIASSMILGAIGDAYLETNNDSKALNYYLKAANKKKNDFSSPLFLMKAAQVYEKMDDWDNALSTYKSIKKLYPNSNEARVSEKYISRAELKVK